MALAPVTEGLSVRLVRNVFRRNRLSGADKVEGFVAAHIVGRSEERRRAFTAQIVYRARRDYWIHGVTMATVARAISNGGVVRAGVHFLADAADQIALMAELRQAGVDQTERFEPQE